jgi:hypothetical protein
LRGLGFEGVDPAAKGRPAYHPASLLIFISTATSVGFSPAADLIEKHSVTSS